jgi:hypothetical protein
MQLGHVNQAELQPNPPHPDFEQIPFRTFQDETSIIIACSAIVKFMMSETSALLEAYEHLPAEEKRTFTEEVLRRAPLFDSGPLEDSEISNASACLFASLGDGYDADPAAR